MWRQRAPRRLVWLASVVLLFLRCSERISADDTLGRHTGLNTLLHPSHTLSVGSHRVNQGLTDFGASIRTVIFAEMIVSGVCKKDGGDWRSALPRFVRDELQRFSDDVRVLVWESGRAFAGVHEDCQFCEGEGICEKVYTDAFNCKEYFDRRGLQGPELAIVVGTRPLNRIPDVPKQPWVGPQTKFIHLPVSRDEEFLNSRLSEFHLVLPDESWVKPVHVSNIDEFRDKCKRVEKRNVLVYIGRYSSHDFKVAHTQNPEIYNEKRTNHDLLM